MPKLFKLLLALLLAGGSLVACGGDDDDDGADVSADVSADADADPDLEDVADGLAAFGSEECLEASAAFLGAAGGLGGIFAGTGDDLGDNVEALERFGEGAPDEIKADFEIVAEFYTDLVKAMAEIGFDPTGGEQPTDEQMEALAEIGEKFEDSDFEAASVRITTWFEENCGTGG